MEPKNNRIGGWKQVSLSDTMPQSVLRPQPMPIPRPMPLPMPEPPVVPMPPSMDCDDMVLAMAFVKRQKWDETYESEVGFERGTIFPPLDLPFVGEGACPHDE